MKLTASVPSLQHSRRSWRYVKGREQENASLSAHRVFNLQAKTAQASEIWADGCEDLERIKKKAPKKYQAEIEGTNKALQAAERRSISQCHPLEFESYAPFYLRFQYREEHRSDPSRV
jgi:hypothetical protein